VLNNPRPIAYSKPRSANFKRVPTPSADGAQSTDPTPAPTGKRSDLTTVHISDESDFALLLPKKAGGELNFPTVLLRFVSFQTFKLVHLGIPIFIF
jgi:hypothetical protein